MKKDDDQQHELIVWLSGVQDEEKQIAYILGNIGHITNIYPE